MSDPDLRADMAEAVGLLRELLDVTKAMADDHAAIHPIHLEQARAALESITAQRDLALAQLEQVHERNRQLAEENAAAMDVLRGQRDTTAASLQLANAQLTAWEIHRNHACAICGKALQ